MNPLEKFTQLIPNIENKINYSFKDKHLLILAFVHRSFINENRLITANHNERLEFLGDSILGFLIAQYLYESLPSTPEGELSSLRSRLVEAIACTQYVNQMQIEEYLFLGKGERRNNGRGRESILADLFEAIIGAIYLDGGYSAAKNFLFNNFSSEIEKIIKKPLKNWKALLQDYTQKKYHHTPEYQVISESGPDHSKIFLISVNIADKELGRGEGVSKKEAQQAAAENAFNSVEEGTL